jgi:hypothetical protein
MENAKQSAEAQRIELKWNENNEKMDENFVRQLETTRLPY